MIELVDDPPGDRFRQAAEIVPHDPHAEGLHGVAGVERERDAALAMERMTDSSGRILSVQILVHEERMPQQLDRGGGVDGVLGAAAECAAGGQAESWTEAASVLERLAHEIVEMSARLLAWEPVPQRLQSQLLIVAEASGERACRSGRSVRSGSGNAHEIDRPTVTFSSA